jgi:hypothetical protein
MTFGAEGGIKDSLGSRRECLEDVIEVLHGGFLLVCVSHSRRVLLARPSLHRAQPESRVAVFGHSPQAHNVSEHGASLNGQQRTTAVGWNTERLMGVSAAGGPLWFPSMIAINAPAQRQPRTAQALRGGH